MDAPTVDAATSTEAPPTNAQKTPNTPDTNDTRDSEKKAGEGTLRSYTPSAAYGGWRPACVFNHTECKVARKYARTNHYAMFSAEISDTSRAMNYIVGPWDTAVDMVVRRELFEKDQASLLMCNNPKALGAVYECVYKDQRCQSLFDLEFYADAKHGNAHLADMAVMDGMTRTVARMGSLLMAELFPDQVTVVVDSSLLAYAPPKDAPTAQWASRALVEKYYKPSRESAAAAATIDPERHWAVVDASKDAKRSQHLVLDGNLCGLFWDTLLDQAIFVGLLLRRIYTAAFLREPSNGSPDAAAAALPDSEGMEHFVRAARGLFVTDLHGDTDKVWVPMVDPVVYKTFQLIRTAFSSKRTQYRPLLPRTSHIFPLAAPEGSRSQELLRTLMGRVPQDHRTGQRLSFSACYPGMFPGVDWTEYGKGKPAPPTCALPLGAWKWVPNYQSRGDMAPPRLNHTRPDQGPEGPWSVEEHAKSVRRWLAHIDPTTSPPSLFENGGGLAAQLGRAPTPSEHILHAWSMAMGYDASGREAVTASECIARFIAGSADLAPWAKSAGGVSQLAAGMTIKVSARKRSEPNRPLFFSALVCTNDSYCPIQRAKHQGFSPFLLINGDNGAARVKCLAAKCENLTHCLPICFLPEQLRVIFPHATRHHPSAPGGSAPSTSNGSTPSALTGSSPVASTKSMGGAPSPPPKRRKTVGRARVPITQRIKNI